MRLELALFSTSLTGLLCCAVAVNGFFDGQLSYCDVTGQRCQHLPDWIQLNQSVTNVQRTPGMAPWKILGAMGATAAFSVATVLARKLVDIERENLALGLLQTELKLRKAGIRAHIDLEAFRKQALLESAEAAYAIFEPYLEAQVEQPLLDGVDSLNPSTKLSSGEQSAQSTDAPLHSTADTPLPQHSDTPQNLGDDSGQKILDAIVSTTRSTVIAAATGTGKSVSVAYILSKFFQRFKSTLVWVIAQKNDDFCGLARKGQVTLFDVLNPEDSLKTIDNVWDIFDKRRRLPEHEREQFKDMPVRLILADWHSVYDSCRDEKWFQPYLKKLSTIITVGRELNVCLLIDTQSFNLDALGLAKDTNIRHNLNILSQGFTWINQDGETQGDYGVLENILKNPHIIHESGLREHLREQLRSLKTQSQRFGLPIIFTTIEPPRLAILPDIRHYKPGQTSVVKPEDLNPEYLEKLYRMETFLEHGVFLQTGKPNLQDDEPPILSDKAKKLLDFLGRRTQKTGHKWSSVRDVQRSEPIEGAKRNEIEKLFEEIVAAQLGELNDVGDISLF